MKKVYLALILLAAVISGAAQTTRTPAAPYDAKLWRQAQEIHRKAIVIDGHNDVTTPMTSSDYDIANPPPQTPYRTTLATLQAGGVTGEFFSLYIRPYYVEHGGAARRTMEMIEAVQRAVERSPQRLVFATTADEIRRAKKQGKVACLLGIEGGHAIENSLAALRLFRRLGVRYMTLTWNNTNDWADAGRGKKVHGGLSKFGEEVVREMNRIGMMVDVSHVSDDTMSDVLDISAVPIIASHSSARALKNVPRNIPDALLKRIATNGGVVMVNFYQFFVDPNIDKANDERDARLKGQYAALDEQYKNDPEGRSAAGDALEAANPLPATPVTVLVDHIEHIIKVAGIDHVGIGADFDGAMDMGEIRDISGLPLITYELLKRGYKANDIRKILGENILRVMAANEKYAREKGGRLSGDGSLKRINRP